jgi:hypothetical protein
MKKIFNKKSCVITFSIFWIICLCLSVMLVIANKNGDQQTKKSLIPTSTLYPTETPFKTVLFTITPIPTIQVIPTSTLVAIESKPIENNNCNCNKEYNCKDFYSHSDAQSCYISCGGNNWSGLDRDNNGLACESLP